MVMLAISLIRRDGDLQSRASFDARTVMEYTEAAQQGREFVPVVVFFDGTTYWLGDGFHRVRGFENAGRLEVPADIREGTRRDAKLYSVGANDHPQNGLRRNNADKRHAVLMILNDDEWKQNSSSWIAERCGVEDDFVGRVRSEVPSNGTSRVKGKDGKSYPAKKAPREKAPLSPKNSLGAGASPLPRSKNEEESKTPLPPDKPTEITERNEAPTISPPELAQESSASPNLPVSFKTTYDLCSFLSQNAVLLREDSELFEWMVSEAGRLSG